LEYGKFRDDQKKFFASNIYGLEIECDSNRLRTFFVGLGNQCRCSCGLCDLVRHGPGRALAKLAPYIEDHRSLPPPQIDLLGFSFNKIDVGVSRPRSHRAIDGALT
jgi:hypothetical protein